MILGKNRRLYFLLGVFVVGFVFSLLGLAPWRINAKEQIIDAKKDCSKESDRTSYIVCFRKALEKGIKRVGIKPYMQALEEVFKEDDDAGKGGITRCHDVAHAVGQLGAIHSRDLQASVSSCTSLCTSGCYHGVVEGYIALGKDITQELPNLCQEGLTDSAKIACLHGLGHGVASVAGFDLTESLKLCDLVRENGRRECGSGVFMELYEPSSFGHELLEFPKDIPGFCQDVKSPYDEVCYRTAGVHEYARAGEKVAARTCLRVPGKFRSGCISSLAQNVYFRLDGDAGEVLDFCYSLSREDSLACISGALEASAMSDPLARHGYELCNLVKETDKNFCSTTLQKKIERLK